MLKNNVGVWLAGKLLLAGIVLSGVQTAFAEPPLPAPWAVFETAGCNFKVYASEGKVYGDLLKIKGTGDVVTTPTKVTYWIGDGDDREYYTVPVGHISSGDVSCSNLVIRCEGFVGIGCDAFRYCTSLRKVVIDRCPEIESPSYEWHDEGAFLGCSNLVEVVVDGTLKTIGVNAFRNCPKLRKVWCTNGMDAVSVELIRDAAFAGCSSLECALLPKTLTTLEPRVYRGCSSLKEIDVPDSVTSLGADAFIGCTALTKISVGTGLEVIQSGRFPLDAPGLDTFVVRGAGDARIESGAFTGSTVRHVALTGVAELCRAGREWYGDGAFRECTNLVSFTADAALKTVGINAFRGDVSLKRVVLPGVVTLEERAFDGCSGLEEVELPSSLTVIDNWAFLGCSSLREVDIPDSVTGLGADAFIGCTSLEKIAIGSGLSVIQSGRFPADAANLDTLVIRGAGDVFVESQAFYGSLVRHVVLQGVAELGGSGRDWYSDGAFRNCSNLVDVVADASLKRIGMNVFANDVSLKTFTAPGLEFVGTYAFLNCLSIRDFVLSDSVTQVDAGAFSGCTGLKRLTIGSGWSPVWEGRFDSNAEGLETLTINGNGEGVVGERAFRGFAVRRLVIKGVGEIQQDAFADCSGLSVVVTAEDDIDDVREMLETSGFDTSGVTFVSDTPDFKTALVFDGYALGGGNALVALVQVKTGAKKTVKGVTTVPVTATVTDAEGKKWSYSGGTVVKGVSQGLVCTAKGCPVEELSVVFSKDSIGGTWGEAAIVGARNGLATKGDWMAEALDDYLGKWSVTLSVPEEESGADVLLRLQLGIGAKGVVKVAGNWEDGEKVSASTQLLMGEDAAEVPLLVKPTAKTRAVEALVRIELPDFVENLCGGELVAGGRTETDEIALGEYVPDAESRGGVTYAGRMPLESELMYPAKFSAKNLPKGLKIDSTTGAVTGVPTVSGSFDVTFEAVSAGNAKAKDAKTVTLVLGDLPRLDLVACGEGTGKLAGAGSYLMDKTVTLKATPDTRDTLPTVRSEGTRKSAFAGWYLDPQCTEPASFDGIDYRSPSVAYLTTDESVTFYAKFVPVEDDVASVDFDMPEELPAGQSIDPVLIDVSGCSSLPSVKVSNLPSGLKFTAKDIMKKGSKTVVEYPANTVYGTPTKSGVYTLVATATTAGGSTAVKSIVVTVRREGELKVMASVAEVGGEIPGTVKGPGVYAEGKPVTVSATAGRGFVFCCWNLGGVPVSQAATYKFAMPATDVAFVASFATLEDELAELETTLGDEKLSVDEPLSRVVSCGVSLNWPLAANGITANAIAVSGLPAGLKFTAKDIVDAKTKEVTVPANTIYGVPTKASSVSKEGLVTPFRVKVTVTTAGKQKVVYPVDLTVYELPDYAVGTYNGAFYDAEKSLSGTVKLTVSVKGAFSGKIVEVDGTEWKVTAASYDETDESFSTFRVSLLANSKDVLSKKTVERVFTAVVSESDCGGDIMAEETDGEEEIGVSFRACQDCWNGAYKDDGARFFREGKNKFRIFDGEEVEAEGLDGGQSLVLKIDPSGNVTATLQGGVYMPTAASTLLPLTPPGCLTMNAEVYLVFSPNVSKGFEGLAVKVTLSKIAEP